MGDGTGSAVDCTGDAPLYVGQYDAVYDDRMVNCYFGRIDDPTIELVELQIRAEPFDQAAPEFYCLSVEREAFIKQGDHTFFWIMEVLPRKRIRNGRTDIRLFLPMTPKETW